MRTICKKNIITLLIAAAVFGGMIFWANPVFAAGTFTTNQSHFQFKGDTGGETATDWLAAQDANLSRLTNSNFRVRIHFYESGNVTGSVTPLLEYKLASGSACTDTTGWTTITTSTTNAFALVDSANFTEPVVTTEQLSSQGGVTFTAGELLDQTNPGSSVAIGPKNETEYVWNIKATDSASATAYIFRVSNNGTNLTNYNVCPQVTVLVPPDLTWATGAADFEIFTSSSLTWDAGGPAVCSGTLTDTNADTISCSSGSVANSTQYRVQAVLKNVGGIARMISTPEYVDHKNVKAGWAGTNPTLGTCGFNDFGLDDDVSVVCILAYVGNDVRITNEPPITPDNVLISTGETEGFMYLITTDSDVPSSDSTSYMDTSIDDIIQDSSKITITGSAAGPTLTFSISDNAIGFSNLDSANERWATGSGSGSPTETPAHTLTASTNATNGYTITVNGTTLASTGTPSHTITAIGASAANVTTGNGTEQFGIRLTASGTGTPSSPYNGATNMYALDTAAFPDAIATGAGDGSSTIYSVFYAANIAATTEAHTDYTASLTYVATGNF
ncbi:MAG: hypothetical protein Q8Q38_00665 [bacterium]|nr:hypothetical protein [bacterium]